MASIRTVAFRIRRRHGRVASMTSPTARTRANGLATVGVVGTGAVDQGGPGLTAYITPDRHDNPVVTRRQQGRRVTLRRGAADLVVEQSVAIPPEGRVRLRVTCDRETFTDLERENVG
jgi:hypothetical protein